MVSNHHHCRIQLLQIDSKMHLKKAKASPSLLPSFRQSAAATPMPPPPRALWFQMAKTRQK
jgi:hypothetical protein